MEEGGHSPFLSHDSNSQRKEELPATGGPLLNLRTGCWDSPGFLGSEKASDRSGRAPWSGQPHLLPPPRPPGRQGLFQRPSSMPGLASSCPGGCRSQKGMQGGGSSRPPSCLDQGRNGLSR